MNETRCNDMDDKYQRIVESLSAIKQTTGMLVDLFSTVDDVIKPRLLVCNDTDCEVRAYCDHAKPHFENEECQFTCEAELPCAVCQPVEVIR